MDGYIFNKNIKEFLVYINTFNIKNIFAIKFSETLCYSKLSNSF